MGCIVIVLFKYVQIVIIQHASVSLTNLHKGKESVKVH